MKQTFKNKNARPDGAARHVSRDGREARRLPDDHGVFGFCAEDFIPGVEFAGAAAFLEYAADADVSLFV